MELEDRYLVLKRADIEAALTPTERDMLLWLTNNVDIYRLKQGKPVNSYMVINQDEPYFPAVLQLIEAHQNKEAHAADTARRRSQGAKDGWEIRRGKQNRTREEENEE